MKKEVLSYVIDKTHELMNASTCSDEARVAAQAWLDAVGTDNEAAETKKYLAELEEDIVGIDNLISFASSDDGVKYFGIDTAKGIVEHAKKIKAEGAIYCDCPACLAVEKILEKEDDLIR